MTYPEGFTRKPWWPNGGGACLAPEWVYVAWMTTPPPKREIVKTFRFSQTVGGYGVRLSCGHLSVSREPTGSCGCPSCFTKRGAPDFHPSEVW